MTQNMTDGGAYIIAVIYDKTKSKIAKIIGLSLFIFHNWTIGSINDVRGFVQLHKTHLDIIRMWITRNYQVRIFPLSVAKRDFI